MSDEDKYREMARQDLERQINELMEEDEEPFECPHCHNKDYFRFFFGEQQMKLKPNGKYEVIIEDKPISKPDTLTFVCGNPNCQKIVLETLMY